MPSDTLFLIFLRVLVPVVLVGACAIRYVLNPCSRMNDLPLLASFTFWRRLRRRCLARLARSLAGARVGARALTTHGQTLAMPQAAIAAEVHQPLDAHRHLAAQIAFDGVTANQLAQLVHLRVGQVLDFGRRG